MQDTVCPCHGFHEHCCKLICSNMSLSLFWSHAPWYTMVFFQFVSSQGHFSGIMSTLADWSCFKLSLLTFGTYFIIVTCTGHTAITIRISVGTNAREKMIIVISQMHVLKSKSFHLMFL